jgi:hypothetical protein
VDEVAEGVVDAGAAYEVDGWKVREDELG